MERCLGVDSLGEQGPLESLGLGGRRHQGLGAKRALQRRHVVKMKGPPPAPLVRGIPLDDFQGLRLDLPRVQEERAVAARRMRQRQSRGQRPSTPDGTHQVGGRREEEGGLAQQTPMQPRRSSAPWGGTASPVSWTKCAR